MANLMHSENAISKITAADNIVFIHPMWWFSPPAIMKKTLLMLTLQHTLPSDI